MDEAYGECITTLVCNPDGGTTLIIERADPVVRFSPQRLAGISSLSDHRSTYDAKARILRIEGVNRTVVYRIREMLEPRPGAAGYWDYIGEWPD